MQAVWLNYISLVCYCVLYFMLSLPHLYQHIQHGVSMLIFNMVSELPSCGHDFLPLRYIQEKSSSSSVFFFSLCSSSLASYCYFQNSPVQSSHRQKSYQHCKTIAFLKLPSQSQTSFKGSSQPYQISRFHQVSILSLRGGVRDILAHQYRPKPNSTLCASQVSYLYQKSISLGFSLLYIHML